MKKQNINSDKQSRSSVLQFYRVLFQLFKSYWKRRVTKKKQKRSRYHSREQSILSYLVEIIFLYVVYIRGSLLSTTTECLLNGYVHHRLRIQSLGETRHFNTVLAIKASLTVDKLKFFLYRWNTKNILRSFKGSEHFSHRVFQESHKNIYEVT